MARLNAAEKRLLRYPPTQTTWECLRSKKTEEGTIRCGQLNSGTLGHCWLCRAAKPKKPKLIWPRYVAACQKAGIEPGERWRDPADAVELAAAYRQRQKAADARRKGKA